MPIIARLADVKGMPAASGELGVQLLRGPGDDVNGVQQLQDTAARDGRGYQPVAALHVLLYK